MYERYIDLKVWLYLMHYFQFGKLWLVCMLVQFVSDVNNSLVNPLVSRLLCFLKYLIKEAILKNLYFISDFIWHVGLCILLRSFTDKVKLHVWHILFTDVQITCVKYNCKFGILRSHAGLTIIVFILFNNKGNIKVFQWS